MLHAFSSTLSCISNTQKTKTFTVQRLATIKEFCQTSLELRIKFLRGLDLEGLMLKQLIFFSSLSFSFSSSFFFSFFYFYRDEEILWRTLIQLNT